MISLGLVRGEIFQFKQTSEFRGPHSEIRLAKLIKHSAQYVTEREKMVKCNSRLLLRNHAKEKKARPNSKTAWSEKYEQRGFSRCSWLAVLCVLWNIKWGSSVKQWWSLQCYVDVLSTFALFSESFQCKEWTLLYDSREHGQSLNRWVICWTFLKG